MGKKRFLSVIALLLTLVFVLTAFAGCSQEADSGDDDDEAGSNVGDNGDDGDGDEQGGEPPVDPPVIAGKDAFNGERFTEMLWGYYEVAGYDYNGSFEDSAEFRGGMEYIEFFTEYGDTKLSVLPLDIQFGKYTHFMSSFTYEGKYYDAFTPTGRAMFRKAYMQANGDMTEEQFNKIEKLLDMDVVSVTLVNEKGATYSGSVTYRIEGNKVSLYDVFVDDDFTITVEDTPIVQYDFLHTGGALILSYDGIQRTYLTNGYKESDYGLYASGYALNSKSQYEDLLGFALYQNEYGDEFDVYVDLDNGNSPIDPVMELDIETGSFTLSWQAHYDSRYNRVEQSRTIRGTFIPCTSYAFTNYEGFFLIIDGTCYRYLMSDEEYDELIYGNIDGSDGMTDEEREEINNAKNNILDELETAFQEAGIAVSIDKDSGQISLEANFLFATDSYALSQQGKEYLDAFMEVYASVVLEGEFSNYVSGIIIEGHTDTSGSYSHNQTLSQNRANAVAEHCIAQNAGIASVIEAIGCSYDYPVYNDDGSVNMAASRRVTFRFVLTAN